MKLNLVQGTPAWRAWRMTGVGASDSGAIMGVSIYQTASGVWRLKRGLEQEAPPSYPARRGSRLEPEGRRIYEQETGIAMPAATAVHDQRPHMLASLDGWNVELKRILEIKCPMSREDHALAVRGYLPEKYKPQVQHELAVTGAEQCDYESYVPGQKYALVTVEPDPKFQALLMEQIDEFWHLVVSGTPPALVDLDYELMRAGRDQESRQLHERWKNTRSLVERSEIALEQVYAGAGLGPFRKSSHPRIPRRAIKRAVNKGFRQAV